MLELTEPLRQAVAQQQSPLEVFDPTTNTRYVLIKAEIFERLQSLAYDDSPWTDEEQALLAAESGQTIGWDEMEEYDDYERKGP
jgi:hypothetical protein